MLSQKSLISVEVLQELLNDGPQIYGSYSPQLHIEYKIGYSRLYKASDIALYLI
jgi:hypothetical protein